MCLLVVASRCEPGRPLVVAANRDERYDRPASPVQVLAAGPLVLGGRDDEAGGTWLAVNEHGVVAGLTNQPAPGGRDPTKRTRGELPLLAARHADARRAADGLLGRIDPAAYNPCSLLIADREALVSIELDGRGGTRRTELAPGRYVLENRPLGAPTAKAALVARRWAGLVPGGQGGCDDQLVATLRQLLADHAAPDPLPGAPDPRPPAAQAACVHGDAYGTRSAIVVAVAAEAGQPPAVFAADGPPCTTSLSDRTGLWAAAGVAARTRPAGRPAATRPVSGAAGT